MSSRSIPLILASRSPRRADLLKALGLPFSILRVPARETAPPLPPDRLTRLLAWRKAAHARERVRSGVIVAADTTVFLKGRTFGKPNSRAHARRQLAALSGRTHRVLTGIALIHAASGAGIAASARTTVALRRLDGREIESYVASGEPFGKAGSYAIQGRARTMIRFLRGDYFNVVGFPVRLFATLVGRFGVRVPAGRVARLYRAAPRFPRS